MGVSPFQYRPDEFTLVIPADTFGMTQEFFESAWGVTDELLCRYEGTLIGRVDACTDSSEFWDTKTIHIALLPKLDVKRDYDWPAVQEFANALRALLSNSRHWYLRCEQDCEQNPVEQIQGNMQLTVDELDKVFRFVVGDSSDCPSFASANC